MQPIRKHPKPQTLVALKAILATNWHSLTKLGVDGSSFDEVIGHDGKRYQIMYARWVSGMPGFIDRGSVWVIVAVDVESGEICLNYVYHLGAHGWTAFKAVARHLSETEEADRHLSIPCGREAIAFVLCARGEDRFPTYLGETIHGPVKPAEHPEDFLATAV